MTNEEAKKAASVALAKVEQAIAEAILPVAELEAKMTSSGAVAYGLMTNLMEARRCMDRTSRRAGRVADDDLVAVDGKPS